LAEARGDWIAHLDDDDAWNPDHVETLLRDASRRGAELAFSRIHKEIAPQRWKHCGAGPAPRESQNAIPRPVDRNTPIPHSCVLFRAYLRLFRFDPRCWRLGLNADDHVWRRMRAAGVVAAFVDATTVTSPLRPGTTWAYFLAEDRAG
jgi:hypothetical protein